MRRDYRLYELNDDAFERLAAQICLMWLGPGVILFAPGKDGGRDAKFCGTAQCLPSAADPINGHCVVQAKHVAAAESALRRATVIRRPPAGLIHHADRGGRYCAIEYQAERRRHGILMSRSGKGNCYDNAMVETFFKALKSELVWRTVFQKRAETTAAIGRYIDAFYNPVRRHSALDFKSPLQFERRVA